MNSPPVRQAIRTGAVLAALAFTLHAADWSRFRGPNGSGVAGDTGYPTDFGPDRNVVWKTELPPGLSSPVISERHVFLTGLDGELLATFCLDRATGKILWRRHVERDRAEKLHKLNHPASASAVADGRNVFVFFPDFGLVSYTDDGAERWRVALGPFDNTYGMGASPVLAGGLVVLVCDQNRGSFIAAWDRDTGKPRWRVARPDALSGHSTPIVYRDWILAPGSYQMEAYEVQTGRVVWTAQGLPGELKSVPVIDGNLVYIHGYNTPENDPGRLIAIPPFAKVLKSHDKDGNGEISRQEAPTPHVARYFVFLDVDRNGGLNANEWANYARTMQAENALLAFRIGGGLEWKFQRSIPQLPSPLVYQGIVYLINEGGILTTLDAKTGKLHKQARLRGESDRYYASPVAADGRVFIASHTGVVTVLGAGPDQETIAVNPLDEETLATPALAGGRIYLRTRSRLYCFGHGSL
ncbi:MAG: PQQ-binding-like beta-propeller repeat protein [Bryobacteraceae bacterium]